jgi:hypothetical protein
MSDAPKPESSVKAEPQPAASTAITKRFPGTEDESLLNLESRDRGDTVYRPVSIFAVAALGIAACYATVIIFGALVAAIQREPWLIGGWHAVFPVLALVLAGVAWFEIQSSEGTRTGKRMAGWAAMLSIMVSLGYWAYYGATYIVVRNQAQAYCEEYFDKIKNGKLESAFIMAVAPKSRPKENSGLRDEIEHRFNPEPLQKGRGGGMFNRFKEHLLTHVLIQGGKDVKVEPLGVASWDYKGAVGGYVLRVRYRLAGPELGFEGEVAINSMEPQGKASEGRQWSIALAETSNSRANLINYDDGKLLWLQYAAAVNLNDWQSRLRSMGKPQNIDAYLSTMDAAAREGITADFRRVMPSAAIAMTGTWAGDGWTGLAGSCAATLASETRLPKYAEFTRGDLVQMAPDFWAPALQAKDKMLSPEEVGELAHAAARSVFHTTADMPMGVFEFDPEKMGYWSHEANGVIRFRHHFQLRVRSPSLPQALEGDILSECPESFLETGPKPGGWRVVGVELTNLRTLPQMTPPGQGGGEGPPQIPGMGKQ